MLYYVITVKNYVTGESYAFLQHKAVIVTLLVHLQGSRENIRIVVLYACNVYFYLHKMLHISLDVFIHATSRAEYMCHYFKCYSASKMKKFHLLLAV